nr:hypothetical protein [Nocardioides ungokensis]
MLTARAFAVVRGRTT